jgi:hypothetical protein
VSKINLSDILKAEHPLPTDTVMIEKALEILNASPHGQQLVDFVHKNKIAIKIIATQQPTTYLPESNIAYIGINKVNPISPSQFVLMLAGVLREAQQESAGIKHPTLHSPLPEHMNVSMAKHEDKIWYICTVACELNDQPAFTEYNFLDSLRKMGHSESLELYLKQERRK